MTWLITGGADTSGPMCTGDGGPGERVVAVDDLSAGNPARLPAGVPLVNGSPLTAAG